MSVSGGIDQQTGLPVEVPLFALWGETKRYTLRAFDDNGQAIDLSVAGTTITTYVARKSSDVQALFTRVAAGLQSDGTYYWDVTEANRASMYNGDELYYTTVLVHSAYTTPRVIGRGPLYVEFSAFVH